MKYPAIDVWRMSASRPWQLEQTTPILHKHLKYSGELKFHLIESVLIDELSKKCVDYAKSMGYSTHIIDPAKGQGYACWYALNKVIQSEYSLKWEDDFQPEVDIPLDDCIEVMEKYKHINQICFNKRETMAWKWADAGMHNFFKWYKEQREFKVGEKVIPLVIKEKWWFGSSIWRTSFIKPKFKWWPENTHNLLNDEVLSPLAGYVPGDATTGKGRIIPTPSDVEKNLGTFIYGRTGDKRMVEHTGRGDSIFAGEYKKKMEEQGYKLKGT